MKKNPSLGYFINMEIRDYYYTSVRAGYFPLSRFIIMKLINFIIN